MRRIFTVDPTGRDERVFVFRGTRVGSVEVIESAGLLRMETVIRTAAYRAALRAGSAS